MQLEIVARTAAGLWKKMVTAGTEIAEFARQMYNAQEAVGGRRLTWNRLRTLCAGVRVLALLQLTFETELRYPCRPANPDRSMYTPAAEASASSAAAASSFDSAISMQASGVHLLSPRSSRHARCAAQGWAIRTCSSVREGRRSDQRNSVRAHAGGMLWGAPRDGSPPAAPEIPEIEIHGEKPFI